MSQRSMMWKVLMLRPAPVSSLGQVVQGAGLVQQLHQYSFVRDCLEAGFVEDGKGVVRPVGGDDHHAVLSRGSRLRCC